jgi:hypothetical protein
LCLLALPLKTKRSAATIAPTVNAVAEAENGNPFFGKGIGRYSLIFQRVRTTKRAHIKVTHKARMLFIRAGENGKGSAKFQILFVYRLM